MLGREALEVLVLGSTAQRDVPQKRGLDVEFPQRRGDAVDAEVQPGAVGRDAPNPCEVVSFSMIRVRGDAFSGSARQQNRTAGRPFFM